MAKVSKREWTAPNGEKKSAWMVRYQQGGKHRSRQFEKKKDADAYRLTIENSQRDGTLSVNTSLTLGSLARDYLLSRQQMHRDGALARSSLHRETFHIENHLVPDLGKIILSDITCEMVDRHFVKLRATPRKTGNGKLHAGTAKKIVQVLASMLDYAQRRRCVGRNVAREVLSWPEHRSGSKRGVRTFAVADVKALLAVTDHRRPHQMARTAAMGRAMVYLAAFCGLRFGEITGLTCSAIDFDRSLIRVRHSLDAWDNLRGPKTTAGRRDVPLPRVVADALRGWLPHRVANDRELVFTSKLGKRITKEPFHRDFWRPALLAAGLGPDREGRRLHFHALRHFFASALIQARMSLTDTAFLMGHRTFDQTLQTYAHPVVDEDHRSDAIEAMTLELMAIPSPVAQGLRTDMPTS